MLIAVCVSGLYTCILNLSIFFLKKNIYVWGEAIAQCRQFEGLGDCQILMVLCFTRIPSRGENKFNFQPQGGVMPTKRDKKPREPRSCYSGQRANMLTRRLNNILAATALLGHDGVTEFPHHVYQHLSRLPGNSDIDIFALVALLPASAATRRRGARFWILIYIYEQLISIDYVCMYVLFYQADKRKKGVFTEGQA